MPPKAGQRRMRARVARGENGKMERKGKSRVCIPFPLDSIWHSVVFDYMYIVHVCIILSCFIIVYQ